MITVNAKIESASIQLDRDCFLNSWLTLNYGVGCQGFGGYVLGGLPDIPAGRHEQQKNLAAEWIVSILIAAEVTKWSDLPGKCLRVKKVDEFGDIIAIGHITRDDRWFNPKERMAAMCPPAEEPKP